MPILCIDSPIIIAPILSTRIWPDRRGGGRAFYSLVSIYILHFSAAASEGFAPHLVLNFVGDSGRLPFPGFVLAFSITFLEGRARRAPTGVLPCPHLGVSSHRRARQPRTGGICAGERRHGRSIFFPPGKLVRCSCSAKTFL